MGHSRDAKRHFLRKVNGRARCPCLRVGCHAIEEKPGAGSFRFEAHRRGPEEGQQDGTRSAPAGSLVARSRGSETESTGHSRAHHSRPKAAQTSNCLIRTPFLRDLSRRVVRVEIGQKPGVVRGTGSSNPSPSSGESAANLRRGSFGAVVTQAVQRQALLREVLIPEQRGRREP